MTARLVSRAALEKMGWSGDSYCDRCGRMTVAYRRQVGYSSQNGRPTFDYWTTCPKHRRVQWMTPPRPRARPRIP